MSVACGCASGAHRRVCRAFARVGEPPTGGGGILTGVTDQSQSRPEADADAPAPEVLSSPPQAPTAGPADGSPAGRPGGSPATSGRPGSPEGGPERSTAPLNHPGSSSSSAVVVRARRDVAAGREWRARDRLADHLAEHYDAEALDLLGDVLFAMRDLPAAGAAWFGTSRRGQDVDDAVEAWREQHADHFSEMWRSLPRSVRDAPGNKRVEALRRRADANDAAERQRRAAAAEGKDDNGGGIDAAAVIAVVIAVIFVVSALVGFVTLLRWVVPG